MRNVLILCPANSARSASGEVASSRRSRARSACSVSAWELTETYSPAAIESAPAASPATAASRIAARLGSAAATPTIRLLVEMRPSLAPRTAARNQPIRSLRCNSMCILDLPLGSQSDTTARSASAVVRGAVGSMPLSGVRRSLATLGTARQPLRMSPEC